MARRRKKQSRPPVTVTDKQPTPRIETALIVSIIAAMLLGGIPFGVGKYIELNSPGPFDSGAYVYSAQRLLDGAQYGTEERSSARPGTLIANLIGVKLFGFSDTGPKIVQMVLQVAALIFMFITIRKVFGSVAAILSTAIKTSGLACADFSPFSPTISSPPACRLSSPSYSTCSAAGFSPVISNISGSNCCTSCAAMQSE
jgi:hypothetical protein